MHVISEYRNEEKNNDRMAVITGLDIKELKVQMEKNSLIKYFIDGFPIYNEEKLGRKGVDVVDTIYGLERLIQHVNKKANIPYVPIKDEKSDEDFIFFDFRDQNKPFQDSFPGSFFL